MRYRFLDCTLDAKRRELQQVVQTLHGHGFRFVAELQRAPGEERRTAASAGARQRADGRPMLVGDESAVELARREVDMTP